MTITLAEPRGFMTYARRISPVHQGCCVYTCMYVFDDVNSVCSWPNNFLDVYMSINENLAMLMRWWWKKNWNQCLVSRAKLTHTLCLEVALCPDTDVRFEKKNSLLLWGKYMVVSFFPHPGKEIWSTLIGIHIRCNARGLRPYPRQYGSHT